MEMHEFLTSIFIGMVIVLCLNTLVSVPNKEIEKSIEVCVDNGGVKAIDFNVIMENKAVCNNGAMFYIRFDEKVK